MKAKVAVAGAGIYGATIAIRLAEQGHHVRLFDPLGVLRAASAINQFRIHSGYHYPRSPETITETLEARAEFTKAFAPAIVRNSRHYYAIPHEGSQTPPDLFEQVMAKYSLVCNPCRPEWMNFDFIDRCYEVDEQIYDPDVLRDLIELRIKDLGIPFERHAFTAEMRPDYDFVVWATYGLGPSRGLFKIAKYQVAEKILIAAAARTCAGFRLSSWMGRLPPSILTGVPSVRFLVRPRTPIIGRPRIPTKPFPSRTRVFSMARALRRSPSAASMR